MEGGVIVLSFAHPVWGRKGVQAYPCKLNRSKFNLALNKKKLADGETKTKMRKTFW